MNAAKLGVLGLNVSRETLARLDCYADMLRKWNPKVNLVASNTLADLESRHFVDSAQLFVTAPPFQSWVDLGSGGGFPGLVVAILAAELSPDARVSLVEADQRKSAFLRTVARETGVGVQVCTERLEALDPQNADVVSARALAPLPRLLPGVARHISPNGTALLPKGRRYAEELSNALETWRFDCEKIASHTDPDGAILKLTEIRRA